MRKESQCSLRRQEPNVGSGMLRENRRTARLWRHRTDIHAGWIRRSKGKGAWRLAIGSKGINTI